MIELAHALGFEVVAEGVEVPEQVHALIELGCDLVQGHVYAPALAPDSAAELLVGCAFPGARELSLRGGRGRATAS